jgi:nucleolar protein 56
MEKSASVILFELGIVILSDTNELIKARKFQNPASAFNSLSMGENKELAEILPELSQFHTIRVNHHILMAILAREGLRVELFPQSEQDLVTKDKIGLVTKFGLSETPSEAVNLLQKFATDYSSIRVKTSSETLDLHAIQAVNALDELDETINTIGTRLREWYGLHYPELDHLLQNVTTYAHLVKQAGSREKITHDICLQTDLPENKIQIIIQMASKSRGGNLPPESDRILQKLADEVLDLSKLRTDLSEMVETIVKTIAPNLNKMLTAVIAARLMARAGSLKRLAFLPASTIQVLGAEKALFRSLKTGARPPKHGLLFQHPAVHSAPKWHRGKIARALASKIAIAARVDLYRPSHVEDDLITRLNKRIEAIQKMPQRPISQNESRVGFNLGQKNQGYFRKRGNENRSKRKDDYRKRIKRHAKRKR